MAKEDEAQTQEEILKAKLALYNRLLRIDTTKITDIEVNTMYELSRDKQVQKFIDKRLHDKTTN